MLAILKSKQIHFTNKEMGFQGNTDIIVHSTKHQWSKQLT